jgi:hypothetical protein
MQVVQPIPKYWAKTLDEDSDVKQWIADYQFPNDVKSMIKFIHSKYTKIENRMLEQKDSMPQSFITWWCHVRAERTHLKQTGTFSSEADIPPNYPIIKKWKLHINQNHPNVLNNQEVVTDTDVITVFISWLNQLFTDIVLFPNDESARKTIPRLQSGNIVRGSDSTSRRTTIRFIQQQGTIIFKERGFKEGLAFWKQICTKYNI